MESWSPPNRASATHSVKEAEAMRRAGFARHAGPGFDSRRGQILIDGPALAHFRARPRSTSASYIHGLARAFMRRGGHLAFGARVLDAKGGRSAHVKLDSGARLRAAHRRRHEHSVQ